MILRTATNITIAAFALLPCPALPQSASEPQSAEAVRFPELLRSANVEGAATVAVIVAGASSSGGGEVR